eukprot:TRINITY_DN6168_c0_g1_i6.p1 TRINITY_DN6168_c0_g1~~TRINITY_DN6168_c0_g1_i6.p1  ORF type:complete len:716 (-),score=82.12 TRINITY_DN6168_c0_g1_i6:60-2207(-)
MVIKMRDHFLVLLVVLVLADALGPSGFPTTVSYDSRAFIINGSREFLLSGCVHYPRSTPSLWPKILKQTKEAGIDVVQTYVFWSVHQPNGPDDWVFDGNANIWSFLDECERAGLYVILRIGPYVCAEWSLGGIPVWVKDIPNIVFRDYNEAWLTAMGDFVTRFTKEALQRNIFAHQGGPVILSQIENEYGNVESAYANPAKYVSWAVGLAQGLTNKEPWLMCQQDDAPSTDNLVNTCNGFYCDNWIKPHLDSRNTPAGWTENWPGWFQNWGFPKPIRQAQDVAFSVARWVSRGGSLMTYYMWHGGTNFGRTSGGPLIVTSYDYDGSIDEYGNIKNPKYTHLQNLHLTLKQYAPVLMANPPDDGVLIQNNVYLSVYGKVGSPDCVAFLGNIGKGDESVSWNGKSYMVPGWSVSVLGGCNGKVTYNTATLPAVQDMPKKYAKVETTTNWQWWPEPIGIWDPQSAIVSDSPLWYTVNLPAQSSPGSHVVTSNVWDVAFFYINSNFQGMAMSSSQKRVAVEVAAGQSTLNILSQTVGLANYGPHYEDMTRGIKGEVDFDDTNITLQVQGWVQQVGLKGERLHLWNNPSAVNWTKDTSAAGRPLTWWKADFATPAGSDTLAFDFANLGKGFAYVNGNALGRYWNITAVGNCVSCSEVLDHCDYRGAYVPGKCVCDCGVPSQRYYHVPRDWLAPPGNMNTLVIIEELGVSSFARVDIVVQV